jgi:dipeptidyl aminopeptidase/acylaminoacyl peptidase
MIKTPGLRGYSMSPVFSRDGKKLAFTRMKCDRYEADRPRLLIIPDISNLDYVEEFPETSESVQWRPEWVTWGKDDQIILAAEKHGRVSLWELSAGSLKEGKSKPLFQQGSVSDAKFLGDTLTLLVTSRSRIENSCYSLLNTGDGSVRELSSSSKHGKSFGLNQDQCSDIWYTGAAGYDIHALVMTPSDFDKSKKYPLAFLIHGGPQSAWMDDWSTRWNPAVFAEQGYVVVCPNPTGSTGYGQDHIDAITENWGGTPYEDLVKCFEYLEKEVSFVDTKNAVALGGSYGGYMISKSSHSIGGA